MGNILDVITRLDYTADTKGLDEAYNALSKNIAAIDAQMASIKRLEALREKTDKENLTRLAQLDRAIENRKNKITQETNLIKGQIAANDNLRKSIESNVNMLNKMTQAGNTVVNAQGRIQESSKATTFTLTNLSYIVQDLPFGFIGIANNITPLIQSFSQLKQETGTTGGAFKQLLAGLTGPQGLFLAVSVVTSLLITFGDRLFESGNEAEKAAEKTKKEKDAVKSLNDELQRNIELRLRQRDIALNAHNQGINEARREEELSKARGDSEEQQYEESKRRIEKEKQDLEDRLQVYAGFINRVNQLFKYYREQETNQGLKKGAYDDLISENVAKLIAETLQVSQEEAAVQAENLLKTFGTEQSIVNTWLDEKAKLYEGVKDKEVELEILRLNYVREQREKEKKTNDEAYKNALEQIDNELELKKLNDSLLQIIASRIATAVEVNRSLKQLRMEEGKPYTAAEQEAMDKQLESDIKFYESLRAIQEKKLELGALQQKIDAADNMGQSSTSFRLSARKLDEEIFTSRMPREYIDAIPYYNPLDPKNVSAAMKETSRVIEKVDEKQFKKADELRKKRNKERIEAAKDLANSLIQIMEQVNARQIALLDQEIQIRQQRVSQATELAKAGNAEILKSEQERLNETMKERKKAANAQLQLNAAMQISSAALAAAQAIETITNAGTKGDPYTIAIRIAAAVAALGAGIFAVKSLMGGAYKDGVVDFKGKGTGTSDSNIVRISRGESVITAKATSKYRGILEAMNANKPLPLPMPITLQPQTPNASYRTLERRLDKIAGLLEGNGVNVRTSVTNGQIATIVESQRKIESRRWS